MYTYCTEPKPYEYPLEISVGDASGAQWGSLCLMYYRIHTSAHKR